MSALPSPPRLGPAGFAALLAGLLAGLVLFLPWEFIWDATLKRKAAEEYPGLRLAWQSIDRASMLGFRLNGASVDAPGWPVALRLPRVEVRLGVSPRLTLRADTGGRELRLVYLDSGDFDLRGAANLSCLGRRDLLGAVEVRAEGRLSPGRDALDKGLLDLRGASLQLPGGLWLADAVLALEYKEGDLRIRNFTLREPVQVRAEGAARLTPGALLASPYSVSGEIVQGRESLPLAASGRLGDFLGGPVTPE